MAGKWQMAREFGKAIGKKVGKPTKTSKMIEDVGYSSDNADRLDAFVEGQSKGAHLKEGGTDYAYKAMYDKLDDNARRVFKNYNMDFERSYGPDGAYQEAVKRAGVDPNDVPSNIDSWRETFGFDISEPAPKNAAIAKRTEARADRESDMRLEDDFDKGFADAAERHGYDKWHEESKDLPLDDGFGGAMHDVNREDAVQRAREEMIEELKNGMPLEDFFDKYRWR